MKELTIKECRERELAILDYIVEVCKANNIQYFLFFGTLLGAVRHKGFIPWDDDVDIVMSKPDYERFLRCFPESEEYELKCYRKCDTLSVPFIKVADKRTRLCFWQEYRDPQEYGVFVDIFPYENIYDNAFFRTITILKTKILQNLLFYKTYKIIPKTIKDKIEIQIANMHSTEYYNKRIDQLSFFGRKCSNKVKSVFFPSATSYVKKTFMREYFATVEKIEFEGRLYDAPKSYKKCLEILYGDYMRLPPPEEQQYTHQFKAFPIDQEKRL